MHTAIDMTPLLPWQGRQATQRDTVTGFPLQALKATLEAPYAGHGHPGEALPPLWHWLYCLPLHARSALGDDGHARKGGFLPPVPLPRRMWAGGRFGFVAPLRVGDVIDKTSTIASISAKPRPAPGLDREAFSFTKRHKARSWSSAGTPWPRSATCSRTYPPMRSMVRSQMPPCIA